MHDTTKTNKSKNETQDRPKIWRNDITGLRALAVIPVLLFHAFPQTLTGGFFGVDIFFVISGYLISGIIFRGLILSNFSYSSFYSKRIKRIIPNLSLILAFVVLIGFLILLPNEYKNLGKHVYSSAGFFQNFRLLNEISYFSEDSIRKPLLHLWSLAIEEQFYILFPILCFLLWKAIPSEKALGSLVLIITITSIVFCLTSNDPNFSFYFPLTRFWEIGVGILLSYLETFYSINIQNCSTKIRSAISLVALLSILIPICFYTPAMRHPGPITLFPVIGSALLIACKPDAYINRTLLSWKPITFIGLISYSLYLWHWPLFSFLYIAVGETNTETKICTLLLSFILATLSYLLIETPFRKSKLLLGIPSSIFFLLIALLFILIGQLLRLTNGLPNRPFNQKFSEVTNVNKVDGDEAYNLAPKLNIYGVDISLTKENTFPTSLIIGDSHAFQYFGRAQKISDATNEPIGVLAYAACFVPSGEIYSPTADPKRKEYCKKTSTATLKLLQDKRIKKIIFAQKWGGYPQKAYDESFKQIKNIIQKRNDLQIFVLLDYPWTPRSKNGVQGFYNPLQHFNRINFNKEDFVVPFPKEKDWLRGNQTIEDELYNIASFINPTSTICPNNKCNLLKWYRDDNHLQPLRLEKEGIWLDSAFITKPYDNKRTN